MWRAGADAVGPGRYPPLFVACGTGFCGSLTTWSGWMYDVFAIFANVDEPTLGRFTAVRSVALERFSFPSLPLTRAALSFSWRPPISSPPVSQ
jgi:hypothetical protein